MSLWQTQSWQDMLIASGQTQEYFIIELDVASLLGSQRREFQGGFGKKIFVEKRKVSLGEYGLFVIGLDCSFLSSQEREFNGGVFDRLFKNLQELCAEENCLFAQIETLDYSPTVSFLLQEKIEGGVLLGEDSGESYLKYYKKFIPPYTAVIDLTHSEEEILAAMKQKGRYNIKVAQKNGIEVAEVEKTSENIEKFYELMRETTSRDNFSGNTLAYYQNFLKQENAFLFFAEHENECIAAGIFIASQEVFYYYYGASSSHKRNLMAPYLLQWEAIMYAKKKDLKIYDFLGIAAPDEKNSPLAGVTDFKLRLTPDTRKVSESFLYIHKKWKYQLLHLLKYIKTYIQK